MAKGLFECLHEANLGQYIEHFRLHGVKTLERLTTLTLQDYGKFGITSVEDKKRLFQLIHIVKGVREERRMSSAITMETMTQDKENTPIKINVSSRNKSPKDVVDGFQIPSSLSIQWTPRKRNKEAFVERNETIHSNDRKTNELSETSLNSMQPETLKRLEGRGGILFVQTSPYEPKISPRNRNHHLRQSVSDSEITEDPSDSSTKPGDVTGFGAPKIKTSCVEVIDHKATGYNYGIPGQQVMITPARKQVINTKVPNLDTSRIKVCVRKRPLLRKEIEAGEEDIIGMNSQGTVALNESKLAVDLTEFMQVHKYHYDEVFDDRCSNLEVYAKTAKLLVPSVFKRAKATCFAYGQTGAGKTHTMLGNKEVKGLYLLAAEDIFSMLASEEQAGSGLSVWVSYFEIYCGQLLDLLNNRQRLHAREDSRHNVCIAGLNEIRVNGPQGLIRVVEQGNRLRSTGSSGVNADSSRSHAILQIELQDSGRRKFGRFSFIDLAGSERACDTADPSKVTRFEGAEINTSLLALKECIRALDQDHRHTPFRQSKLTQVLKDSFVGQSKTCMIANIGPGASSAEHTLNTLRYADRVKELRKQAPAHRSPSTPHPSTPSTFSPGNTSTPVKPVKQPLTTRQPTSTSTPIKSRTPRSTSENAKRTLTNSKRKAVKDKTSLRRTPATTRKTKSLVKSNRSLISLSPKSTKDSRNKNDRSSVSSARDAQVKDTPSKRSQAVKNQAREAFLLNNSLPVWEPPQEMELIQKNPEIVPMPPAWEIDNPRFKKSPIERNSNPSQEEFKNLSVDAAKTEATSGDNVFASRPTDTASNNSKAPIVQKEEPVLSAEEQKNSNNTLEVKFDNSFNSDSTIELLAEIDHALRHSLVSPLLDESPSSAQKNEETSPSDHQSIVNTKAEVSDSGASTCTAGGVFKYPIVHIPNGSSPRTDTREDSTIKPEKTPVAVVTGVKSPDTKNTLQRSQSVPSRTEGLDASENRIEQHRSKSPGLRSRLSGRGIETLPSPRDLQVTPRTRNSSEKAKARQSLFQDTQRNRDMEVSSASNAYRPQPSATTPEMDNTSGVIVSTSFAEYLSSHGINIPDIIISPDRKTGNSDRSYELYDKRNMSNSYSVESQRHPVPSNKHTNSGDGDYRHQSAQDRRNHLNVRNQKPVHSLNQRNVYVQSSSHHSMNTTSPRQNRQYKERSGIPVALTSPRSMGRSVHPDSSTREVPGNSHIIRPSPIGQNHESNTEVANQTKGPKLQYKHARLTETDRTHSPVTVEVLHHSALSTFSPVPSHQSSTPITGGVQPHQYVNPKAFTKESLGRSGVYPSYQSSVQSPITKETLRNGNTTQGSAKQTSPAVRRHSYQGSPGHDSSRKRPSLQLNLSGTQGSNDDDVAAMLELTKAGQPGLVRQNSAISRAKDLLLSAHAEQVDEIQQLCEKEWMLIDQFKTGEKELPEYLDYVEDLLRSKLRCIDTFRDQLDSFAAHTPAGSPRSPVEAW